MAVRSQARSVEGVELLDRAGSSHLGDIYLGKNAAGRLVQVCFVDEEGFDDIGALRAELQWAGTLDVPGIVAPSEVRLVEGGICAIAPTQPGAALVDLVRGPGGSKQPVPVELVAYIGREICDVASGVQSRYGPRPPWWVYRLPTPNSVLLDPRGRILWSEFVPCDDPEDLLHLPLDPSVAVRGIGACLYLLLTGLRHAPLSRSAPAGLREVPSTMPTDLEAIVRRSLIGGAGGFPDIATLSIALDAALERRGNAVDESDLARWLQRTGHADSDAPPTLRESRRARRTRVVVAEVPPERSRERARSSGRRSPTRRVDLSAEAPTRVFPLHDAHTQILGSSPALPALLPPPPLPEVIPADEERLPPVWTSLTFRLLVVCGGLLGILATVLVYLLAA